MNNDRTAVEVSDLTVTFSRWGQSVVALDHVNLKVPSGQWVMLVGHNGSGKSTLLKTISGQLNPNSGGIAVCGKPLTGMDSRAIAEHVFHVHQDPLLGTAPKLTLLENLMVADPDAHRPRTSRRELALKYHELLKPLGLADRLKQLARSLSGGERQLVALLIARLRPAAIMLLDEPLAALDPEKAELCLEIIKTLHRNGSTIIEVTHDPALANSAGDRVIALKKGKFVYDEQGASRCPVALQRAWSTQLEDSSRPNLTYALTP